jgi:hypothetical protein
MIPDINGSMKGKLLFQIKNFNINPFFKHKLELIDLLII